MISDRKGWLHLKPWSKAFSSAFCGCLLERADDGSVRFVPCDDCLAALKRVQHEKRRAMDQRAAT